MYKRIGHIFWHPMDYFRNKCQFGIFLYKVFWIPGRRERQASLPSWRKHESWKKLKKQKKRTQKTSTSLLTLQTSRLTSIALELSVDALSADFDAAVDVVGARLLVDALLDALDDGVFEADDADDADDQNSAENLDLKIRIYKLRLKWFPKECH